MEIAEVRASQVLVRHLDLAEYEPTLQAMRAFTAQRTEASAGKTNSESCTASSVIR